MPPQTEPIKLPTNRGEDAAVWLESHGLVAVVPTIRSSDFDYCTDPFMYYIRRRLGLVPAFSDSKALVLGSWFHTWLQHFNDPLADQKLDSILKLRIEEIKGIAKGLGVTGESLHAFVAEEEKQFTHVKAWYKAIDTVKVNNQIGTIRQFLGKKCWQILGCEVILSYRDKRYKDTPIVVTLDILLYNQDHNEIWIADYKTCDFSPKARLALCPLEDQTILYMRAVQKLLPSIITRYSLPGNVKLGGMMHIAIQKPTITFGTKDQPILYYLAEGKRSGITAKARPSDDKWMVESSCGDNFFDLTESEAVAKAHELAGKEPKAVRAETPQLSHYLKRCINWYAGEGDYAHLNAEREADPPVNISFTSSILLKDEDLMDEHEWKLDTLHQWATINPYPRNFPRYAKNLLRFGNVSSYAPFYLCPVPHWPEAILKNKFIVLHRDAELPPSILEGECVNE